MNSHHDNPLLALSEHYQQAVAAEDPSAKTCTLATVDKGQVSMRTLVLRELAARGPVIFINDSSPKWRALMAGGHSELLLFWPSQMRQYRLRGEWQLLDEEEMRQHWRHKPEGSKWLDHYYAQCQPQSSALAAEDELAAAIADLRCANPVDEIPFSPNARGLALQIDWLEYWSASADGLHRRYRYQRSDTGQWRRQCLVP